jgi:hypothetical protein
MTPRLQQVAVVTVAVSLVDGERRRRRQLLGDLDLMDGDTYVFVSVACPDRLQQGETNRLGCWCGVRVLRA